MHVVCTGRTSEAPEIMQRQTMLHNFVMEKSEVTFQSMALLMSSVCWFVTISLSQKGPHEMYDTELLAHVYCYMVAVCDWHSA